jgi:serine/threonine protein kinase
MNCPTREQLDAFLEFALSPSGQREVADHVDVCDACRRELDSLAGGDSNWRLPRPEESEAFAREIDRAIAVAHKRRVQAAVAEDALPGRVFTRSELRLVRIHDVGGLSVVYEFQDEAMGRRVALKVLRADRPVAPAVKLRFEREYRITSSLDHPGVAPVYGTGRLSDGREFFTMRMIGGRTLADLIDEFHHTGGRLSRDDRRFRALLSALRRVCETIDYAHRRGVVHRDLKPQNIQVGDGETIVLDWGAAKSAGEEEIGDGDDQLPHESPSGDVATQADQRVGSPAYMSPEQAVGGSAEIDCRTDVYGLGTILFQILVGQPPHLPQPQGDADALCRQIEAGPTPRASSRSCGRLPGELDSICAKAMEHDKARRFATAGELADELDRWLVRAQVASHAYSLQQRLALAMQRNWRWTLAAAAVLLAMTVVSSTAAVLVAAAQHQAKLAQQQTRTQAARAQQQRVRAAAELQAAYLAAEIDNRWYLLEREATDETLRRLLRRSLDPLQAAETIGGLQAWNDVRFARHSQTSRATSWFVVNQRGTLVARNPVTGASQQVIGQNFRYRDYFHGRGQPTPAEAADVGPLDDVHRSTVFRSKVTGCYMVAFSVPVWSANPGASDRHVIGVLGMTIEMGRFDSLRNTDNGQRVILVDGNPNWLTGQPRRGLILHHPRLESSQSLVFAELPDDFAAQGGTPRIADHLHLEGDADGPWVTCARPVVVASRTGRVRETGLAVIVQEIAETQP